MYNPLVDLKPAIRPYIWAPPVTLDGKPIAKSARIKTGSIRVPKDIAPGDQPSMEHRFRYLLWPDCSGHKRYSREIVWADGRCILHYRIIDVLS